MCLSQDFQFTIRLDSCILPVANDYVVGVNVIHAIDSDPLIESMKSYR